MKPVHWVVLAAVVGGWWLWQQTPRLAPAPPYQPQPDDDIWRLTHGNVPHCHPEQHHAGYVYTPHRFPRVVGGEITALIHHGYSSMRVPSRDDVQWMIAPPSEAMF